MKAQNAPWPVGTKLKYLGDCVSGYFNDDGETVWSHKKGAIYTVIKITPPSGSEEVYDEEAGEFYTQYFHGWATLQSEFDPDGRHLKGIDIDSVSEFEVLAGE